MEEKYENIEVLEQNKKISNLIDMFGNERIELSKMIDELTIIKKSISELFPETLNARNILFLQEKVKTVTELFKSILEIRKELIKSIKDEIDLRNKVKNVDDFSEILDKINVRDLAKKVKKFQDETEKKVIEFNKKG